MPDFFQLLESSEPPIGVMNVMNVVISVLLAYGLARFLVVVYKRAKRGFSFNPQFTTSVVIISITATFIMAVVGNSVARAFSLAGALSIIRFRNALKETEDVVAIFIAMSIGIACGSGFYLLAITATLLIGLLWLIQSGALTKMPRPRLALIAVETRDGTSNETDISGRLASFSKGILPLGVSSMAPASAGLRFHYKIELKPKVEAAQVISDLSQQYAGAELTWVDEE